MEFEVTEIKEMTKKKKGKETEHNYKVKLESASGENLILTTIDNSYFVGDVYLMDGKSKQEKL